MCVCVHRRHKLPFNERVVGQVGKWVGESACGTYKDTRRTPLPGKFRMSAPKTLSLANKFVPFCKAAGILSY